MFIFREYSWFTFLLYLGLGVVYIMRSRKNCLCRSIKGGLAFFFSQHHRYGSASLKSQHFRDRGGKIRSFSPSVATQRVQSCPSQKQTIGTFLPFVSWFSLFLYGDKFRRLPALSFTLNDSKSVTWRSGVPPHEVLKHERSLKTLQKLANLLRLGRWIKFPITFVLLPQAGLGSLRRQYSMACFFILLSG